MSDEISETVSSPAPELVGNEGVAEAARDLTRRRDAAEQAAQPAPEVLEKLAERQAKHEKHAAHLDELERQVELSEKPELTALEAAEHLAAERRAARERAERDLEEISAEQAAERRVAPSEVPDEAVRQQQAQAQQRAQHEAQQRARQAEIGRLEARAAAILARDQRAAGFERLRLAAEAKAAFPELAAASPHERIAVLEGLSPARRQQFNELDDRIRANETHHLKLAAERENAIRLRAGAAEAIARQSVARAQTAQRENFVRWAVAEDQKVNQAVPELRGAKAAEFREAMFDVLRDAGLSDREIAYRCQCDPNVLSSQAQFVIAAAARQKLAQQNLEVGRQKKSPPRVQRPGVGRGGYGSGGELINLSARLSKSGHIKDAAKLLIAKRAARG